MPGNKMSMNLAIDIGNTHTKLGFFKDDSFIEHIHYSTTEFTLLWLKKVVEEKTIDAVILSSVIVHDPAITHYLDTRFQLLQLTTDVTLRLPFKNLYTTPHTLGNDRLAAVAGAHHLYGNKNILVIDAGTCIKYDFINHKGEYLGGAISPGIEMRFNALHTFTGKLPLLAKPVPGHIPLIGSNTTASITSGVINGAVAEAKNMINEYEKVYPDLQLVLTGGDSKFFDNQLKNSIFAEPFLVLKGLNVLLNHHYKSV